MGYPITECQHCGCETFYTKDYLYGSSWFFCNLDGTTVDNTLHGGLNRLRGKVAYCAECDKKMFNMEEVEDENLY